MFPSNPCRFLLRVHRPAAITLMVAFASSTLAAQTFIVDANNGPGTNFTDLPPAIAAVPSGATLQVRSGSYSPFTIANKSLTIIGRASSGAFPSVTMTSTASQIHLGPLGASHSVTISGLQTTTGASAPAAVNFDVVSCAGPIVLEDVTLASATSAIPITANFIGCANVHASRLTVITNPISSSVNASPINVQTSSIEFTRLTATGFPATTFGTRPPTPAIQASQSTILLVDSSVAGGAGSFVCCGANNGAPAVVADNSTLHVYGNPASGAPLRCQGGAGGGSFPQGAGGVGLVLQQGSSARVRGLTLAGGTGNPPGQPFTTDGSSTIDDDPSDIAPSALLAGVVQPGNTVHYTLFAQPGSPAGLLVGVTAQLQMLPFLTLGALGLNPVVSLAAGTVPGNGKIEIPSLTPAAWPTDTVILAQFAVFDPPTSELSLSNVFTATSRF